MIEIDPFETGNEWFQQELRTVLNALYDPSVLRSSVLVDLLISEEQRDPISTLRRILIDAIEAFQPGENTPLASKSWRVYQILRRRYTEQLVQREVAKALGLSIRQMQREEKIARSMLGDYLWKMYHLGEKIVPDRDPDPDLTTKSLSVQDTYPLSSLPEDEEGFEWLAKNVPIQDVDVRQVIAEVIDTLQPVIKAVNVSVELVEQVDEKNLLQMTVQAQILRQALLNIVNVAVSTIAAGCIKIITRMQMDQVHIHILACCGSGGLTASLSAGDESLEMAKKLIEICNGMLSLSFHPAGPDYQPENGETVFAAEVVLATTQRVAVLVIEDHADTIQLYQRYLTDSRYRLMSAQDARRGIALAEETSPKLIILDVMMPESDGWTLLGQMRVHPRLQDVPIIVCSILPQSRLALSLGAADFLHKPVSRTDLLAALDRQLALQAKGSD